MPADATTDPELEEAERLIGRATAAPWTHDGPGGADDEPYRSFIFGGGTVVADYPREGSGQADANAALICLLRNNAPRWLRELRELREVAGAARKMVRQQLGDNPAHWTPERRAAAHNGVTRAAFDAADALAAYDEAVRRGQ